MRAYRFFMRSLQFGALALTLSCAGANAQAQRDSSLFCVECCTQRTVNGLCLKYGPDFCTPLPWTACVPFCSQRAISGACLHYGSDYCGIAPACGSYCEQRSVTGMCLSYGPDLCYTY
jgi:hypothetical protein